MDTSRRALFGLVYLLVLALLVALSVGVYRKAMPWQRTAAVTLVAARAGLGLDPQSDVKFQGVVVGVVRAVHAEPDGVRVELALDRDKLSLVPAAVDPRVVPKTLFGEKYVDLVGRAHPGPSRLQAGSVLHVSQTSIEVSDLFARLEPILQAVDPAKLSTVLTAIADVLDGRGTQIAATLNHTRAFLQQLDPHLPTLVEDLHRLGRTADVYADHADDLGTVLSSAAHLSKNLLVPRQQDLDSLLDQVTGVARQSSALLDASGATYVRLTGRLQPITRLLHEYASAIGCTITGTRITDALADEAMGSRGPFVSLRFDTVGNRPSYTYPDDLPTNPHSSANDATLPDVIPGWAPHCPQFPADVLAIQNHGPYTQLLPGVVLDPGSASDKGTSSSGTDASADATTGGYNDAATQEARTALARATAASLTGRPQDQVPGYAGLLLTPLVSTGEVDLP
ncbi:MAG: MCE family protein [Nocardioides sp.]|nr:MCE family protein [Nocardioides sp.]